MAASAAVTAILTSTIADSSTQSAFIPLSRRPILAPPKKRSIISCISGGGGVSDEFVSTRKSNSPRGFAVIASMLRRIKPLDNSIISKGVSDSTKDSMKETIATMLGVLPSDQFPFTINFRKDPLHRLLGSAIVQGYTLWNAEYRLSLKRNFDIKLDSSKRLDHKGNTGALQGRRKESDNGRDVNGVSDGVEESTKTTEKFTLPNPNDMSPEALQYIQQLELELSSAKQELHAQKQENLQMKNSKRSNNNVLEYLRSLESEMVTELSRASSPEVEEIIHKLAKSILQRFSNDKIGSDAEIDLYQKIDNIISDTIGTSRDYLAKLLFWCMLLGHHLRGLENRLQLNRVVGFL